MSRNEISKGDNIIDARDILPRIDELKEELTSNVMGHFNLSDEGWDALSPEQQEDKITEWATATSSMDEVEALQELKDFENDIPDSVLKDGETMIHEDHFEDYAEELAKDLGMIKDDAGWPNNHIDWPAAAKELKQDYTTAEWGGETYYFRE